VTGFTELLCFNSLLHLYCYPTMNQIDLLLKHQQDSQEKSKEALVISEKILTLNNQVIEENYKLAGVEKDIAANSTIIEFICGDMHRISSQIEVKTSSILTF
jgi:hypothetical protein